MPIKTLKESLLTNNIQTAIFKLNFVIKTSQINNIKSLLFRMSTLTLQMKMIYLVFKEPLSFA